MTPDPVGFSDGPNLYAYVHNSPMVLIDPYGLTAMEDVGGAGIEAGMGLGRGFIHPLDTLYENSGRLVGLGHDIYNGDFSKFSNVSRQDIANFACARIGETIGACAAGYYAAKAAFELAYGVGTRIVANVVSRGCAKNTCTRMAESRVAIAAEARVATAGETAVASENASGIAANAQCERLVSNSSGYATGWRGCRSYQLESAKFQPLRNASAEIQGRPYTGHAIDQMQNRGIPFSTIENTIANGKSTSSTRDITRNIYFDKPNNISVVVQREGGKVVTVCHGELK